MTCTLNFSISVPEKTLSPYPFMPGLTSAIRIWRVGLKSDLRCAFGTAVSTPSARVASKLRRTVASEMKVRICMSFGAAS